LLEYKKAKESKKNKELREKQGDKGKMKQGEEKKKKTIVRTGKREQKEKGREWIGGGKNTTELEDENWKSVDNMKTEKITRNEMLYHKAVKNTET
jgi:hypothetical protein